ncbi:MAG: hypothetical protein ACKVT0_09185, partial [Planctomycetaceae bacterium]
MKSKPASSLPSRMWFIICLLAVFSLNDIVAADDELVQLPVIGAELIDGGLLIGSPPGDSTPTQGSGHALRPNATEIGFDYLGRSVVADLGQLQWVQRIEVCSTNDTKGKVQNLNEETLELYQSVDNITFERVTGYQYHAHAAAENDFAALRGSAQ